MHVVRPQPPADALPPSRAAEHPGPDERREDQGLLPAGGVVQPAGRHVAPHPVGRPGGHEAQYGARGLARGLEAGRRPLLLEELRGWVPGPAPLGGGSRFPGGGSSRSGVGLRATPALPRPAAPQRPVTRDRPCLQTPCVTPQLPSRPCWWPRTWTCSPTTSSASAAGTSTSGGSSTTGACSCCCPSCCGSTRSGGTGGGTRGSLGEGSQGVGPPERGVPQRGVGAGVARGQGRGQQD